MSSYGSGWLKFGGWFGSFFAFSMFLIACGYKAEADQSPVELRSKRILMMFEKSAEMTGAAVDSPAKLIENGVSFLLEPVSYFDLNKLTHFFGWTGRRYLAGPSAMFKSSSSLTAEQYRSLEVFLPVTERPRNHKLIVVYQRPVHDTYRVGWIPEDEVTIDSGLVRFHAKGDGIYQAIWLQNPGVRPNADGKVSTENLLTETAGLLTLPIKGLGIINYHSN